jgi:tRNA dimethylallyltransferase
VGRTPRLALVGPTASGKTEASIPIALALGAEIVNVDPSLVYRGMDAWTGKPTTEQRRAVPHHLVDLVEPERPFTVTVFQGLLERTLGEIEARGRRALLVGASGLYLRAALDRLRFPPADPGTRRLLETEARAIGPEALHARLVGMDPEAAARIEPRNARRTIRALEVAAVTGRPFSSFAGDWERFPEGHARIAAVWIERPTLYRRIEQRVDRGFDALLEETRRLMAAGHGAFLETAHVIGYAEAIAVLREEIGQEEARRRIARRDKALSRRQLAWLRRDPRVRWFEAGEEGALGVAARIVRYLRGDRRRGSVEPDAALVEG